MKTTIIKNAVKCLECGQTIESKSRHDFKWCRCGAVAVDGGHDYMRRVEGRLKAQYQEASHVIYSPDAEAVGEATLTQKPSTGGTLSPSSVKL